MCSQSCPLFSAFFSVVTVLVFVIIAASIGDAVLEHPKTLWFPWGIGHVLKSTPSATEKQRAEKEVATVPSATPASVVASAPGTTAPTVAPTTAPKKTKKEAETVASPTSVAKSASRPAVAPQIAQSACLKLSESGFLFMGSSEVRRLYVRWLARIQGLSDMQSEFLQDNAKVHAHQLGNKDLDRYRVKGDPYYDHRNGSLRIRFRPEMIFDTKAALKSIDKAYRDGFRYVFYGFPSPHLLHGFGWLRIPACSLGKRFPEMIRNHWNEFVREWQRLYPGANDGPRLIFGNGIQYARDHPWSCTQLDDGRACDENVCGNMCANLSHQFCKVDQCAVGVCDWLQHNPGVARINEVLQQAYANFSEDRFHLFDMQTTTRNAPRYDAPELSDGGVHYQYPILDVQLEGLCASAASLVRSVTLASADVDASGTAVPAVARAEKEVATVPSATPASVVASAPGTTAPTVAPTGAPKKTKKKAEAGPTPTSAAKNASRPAVAPQMAQSACLKVVDSGLLFIGSSEVRRLYVRLLARIEGLSDMQSEFLQDNAKVNAHQLGNKDLDRYRVKGEPFYDHRNGSLRIRFRAEMNFDPKLTLKFIDKAYRDGFRYVFYGFPSPHLLHGFGWLRIPACSLGKRFPEMIRNHWNEFVREWQRLYPGANDGPRLIFGNGIQYARDHLGMEFNMRKIALGRALSLTMVRRVMQMFVATCVRTSAINFVKWISVQLAYAIGCNTTLAWLASTKYCSSRMPTFRTIGFICSTCKLQLAMRQDMTFLSFLMGACTTSIQFWTCSSKPCALLPHL
eukprot:TRINITY_DN4863_c0_g1_i4.p1 TRINITY_DN4863_c0_g1~~TRINITY_DN4863_c0_g1_i4.p1  ORF type:complete len:796 (+),score=41.97 TRINITY_DN4863_c0_g1_i4:705-3092(+)